MNKTKTIDLQLEIDEETAIKIAKCLKEHEPDIYNILIKELITFVDKK